MSTDNAYNVSSNVYFGRKVPAGSKEKVAILADMDRGSQKSIPKIKSSRLKLKISVPI